MKFHQGGIVGGPTGIAEGCSYIIPALTDEEMTEYRDLLEKAHQRPTSLLVPIRRAPWWRRLYHRLVR